MRRKNEVVRPSSPRAAVALLDLTTLAADDTAERVRTLCRRARDPLEDASCHVAAVCVFPRFIDVAREALDDSDVAVCTVAGDFPSARAPLDARVREARDARAAGADEIDVVMNVRHARRGDWDALEDEVRAYREACGDRLMKVILRTGELGGADVIANASTAAMVGGADFVKTSTGRERINATLEAGTAMARAIRAYEQETGRAVGLKPAGGISTWAQVREWFAMVDRELGPAWIRPVRLRFGASGLLDDLRRALDRA